MATMASSADARPTRVQDTSAMDKKAQKRLYIRKKMQQYRNEEKNEVLALKKRIFELENDVIRLTKPTALFQARMQQAPSPQRPLSWKEIAGALKEDSMVSAGKRAVLQRQVHEHADMMHCMSRWVASAAHMQAVLNSPANQQSWRNVTLLRNPASRAKGKDWITKLLFHNTNAMFRHYHFPNDATLDEFCVNDIVFSSACFDTVHCRQLVVDIPYDRLQKALHGVNIWALIMMNPLHAGEIDDGSPKDPAVLHHAMTLRDERANLISREFSDADRTVFVGQQIHDDEMFPTCARQRNRRFWVELQHIGPNQTRMRNLYVISQSFTDRGYLSLLDEAKFWGCDLSATPEIDQEDRFKRHASDVAWKQYNAGNQKLHNSVFGLIRR